MSKLKLGPVLDGKGRTDKNRYCGPSVISALTGMTTGQAARLLRKQTGKKLIKGTSIGAILRALHRCGIDACDRVNYINPIDRPTLAEWLRLTHGERGDKIFLIVAGNHWQVVSGHRYVCGRVRKIVKTSDKVVKRRARVETVFTLHAPNGVKIPPEAQAPKKSSSANSASPWSPAVARAQFMKVARKRGWRHRLDRSNAIDTPDIIIAPCKDFPVGLGTLHYDWDESRRRLLAAVAHPDLRETMDDMEWWSE